MGDVKAQAFLFGCFLKDSNDPRQRGVFLRYPPCWSCSSAGGRGAAMPADGQLVPREVRAPTSGEPFLSDPPGRRVSDIWVIKRYWTSEFCAWTMCDTLKAGESPQRIHELIQLTDGGLIVTEAVIQFTHSLGWLILRPKRRRLLSYRTVRTEWDYMCGKYLLYAWSMGDQHVNLLPRPYCIVLDYKRHCRCRV